MAPRYRSWVITPENKLAIVVKGEAEQVGGAVVLS